MKYFKILIGCCENFINTQRIRTINAGVNRGPKMANTEHKNEIQSKIFRTIALYGITLLGCKDGTFILSTASCMTHWMAY